MPRSRALLLLVLCLILAAAIAGCGSDDETRDKSATAVSFPDVAGSRTAEQFAGKVGIEPSAMLALAGRDFVGDTQGRVPFAMFNDGGDFLEGQTAVYLEAGGKLQGPYAAKRFSLEVPEQFRSENETGEGEPKAVYVASFELPEAGEYKLLAVTRRGEGWVGGLSAFKVLKEDPVPERGDKAPVIDTPTPTSAGGIEQIETRIPPDPMHEQNFRQVVGKGKPVVLVFATPALCASRVCGPVVDVTLQVRNKLKDQAVFIHQEIYNENDLSKGYRKQVGAYGLPSEPFTFVVDGDGRIAARLEGAFGAQELEAAVRAAR